ncbi:hypothetical protein PLESTB_001865900 [Pleodorina starrii]|uniref:Glyoxal or galactose oxidase n=1 Tax=Pleodorina starrii TaxID=330485 RepID=A0A9W6C1R1_9CHLO|nr:hypothetical protein PLESTB_001865900 [Pleodorina starrii]
MGPIRLRRPSAAVAPWLPIYYLVTALLLVSLVGSSKLEATATRIQQDAGGAYDMQNDEAAADVSSLDSFHGHARLQSRGGRGLQQVMKASPPPPPPPAASFRDIGIRAPVIAIGMASVPGTHKYLFTHRALNSTHALTLGTVDLDTNKTTLINSGYEHFCAGQLVLGDGRPILVGGYNANLVLGDGRRIVSVYNSVTNTVSKLVTMRLQRWYPTPTRLDNGSVLVVGGTAELDKGPPLPYAELFNPNNPGGGTVIVDMPLMFKQNAGNNWFPFINQLPRGEVLWWGNRAGSITTTNWTLVRDLPPLPAEYTFHTMYKYTSAVLLHALKPDASGAYNRFTLQIFGGAPVSLRATTPASNLTARLDLWYCGAGLKSICDGGWIIESMGAQRVMGDASVLPNGKILYHGGAQTGRAGLKTGNNNYLAERPAANSIMYDPEAPLGRRFTLTAHIGYARLYHSAACLDLSGNIFMAGCDMCGPRMIMRGSGFTVSPDGDKDYRMQLGIPAEIGQGIVRPTISKCPTIVGRGREFRVPYTYGGGRRVIGASIAAPCAVTHSINMSQRVIFLPLVSDDGKAVTLRAPPLNQPAVAPFGYYMLFLLGENTVTGRTYSEGCWISLAEKV